jgi:hypothetical protein
MSGDKPSDFSFVGFFDMMVDLIGLFLEFLAASDIFDKLFSITLEEAPFSPSRYTFLTRWPGMLLSSESYFVCISVCFFLTLDCPLLRDLRSEFIG